jgi:DNA polymerase-3 subunit delta'
MHPVTKQQLAALTEAPPHALLVVGPLGIGKSQIGLQYAEAVLGLSESTFADYAYSLIIRPEAGKAIGIDKIRELEQFLQRKVPSQKAHHRAIIIEDGHRLTIEAQNALLKTLEEPPIGTILILTADSEQSLLPTIRSRMQSLTVRRPSTDDTIAHFANGKHTETELRRIHAMTGGLPGLMHAVIEDGDHPLMAAVQQARQLLGQTTYERLLTVDQLAKNRDETTQVLTVLQEMAHVSLRTANGKTSQRWQTVLSVTHHAQESINKNGQPKLVLTKLMLEL